MTVAQETITVPMTAKPLYAYVKETNYLTPITLERSATKPQIVEFSSLTTTPQNAVGAPEASRITRTQVRERSDDYLIDLIATENQVILDLMRQQRAQLEILSLLDAISDYDELELVHTLQQKHLELLTLKADFLDRIYAERELRSGGDAE